jgi:hypothetical protein
MSEHSKIIKHELEVGLTYTDEDNKDMGKLLEIGTVFLKFENGEGNYNLDELSNFKTKKEYKPILSTSNNEPQGFQDYYVAKHGHSYMLAPEEKTTLQKVTSGVSKFFKGKGGKKKTNKKKINKKKRSTRKR